MELNIIVNKYLLIWHLLYESSVSIEMHTLKQLIWKEHKKEYSILHSEKDTILQNLNDYIPSDDMLYNMVESSDIFKKIKQETNKYRLTILETWDKSKKAYIKEINNILKFSFDEKYTVCVVHPNLEVVETDFKNNIITIGKKITISDKDNFLTYLVYKIIKNEFYKIKTDEKEIVDTIVELVATNELYTRITGESKYNLGKKSLRQIKEKIYPYYLMYLGVKLEDMDKYMIRDNIFFNLSNYKYETMLQSMDIFSFITFIIKNKKYILKQKTITLENIEIL